MENVDLGNLQYLPLADLVAVWTYAGKELEFHNQQLKKHRERNNLSIGNSEISTHEKWGQYYELLVDAANSFIQEKILYITGTPK